MLGSTLLEVDLDRILQSIHEYFEELGMAEIRKRQVNQKHLLASIHSKCFSPVHYDSFKLYLLENCNVNQNEQNRCYHRSPQCSMTNKMYWSSLLLY